MRKRRANSFRPFDAALPVWRRLRQNPGYAGAVLTFYGLTALQTFVQLALVPIYLDTIGTVPFGALMTLLAIVNVAGLGISWLHGGLLRSIGERYFAGEEGRKAALGPAYTAVKAICLGYGAIASGAIVALAFLPAHWLFGSAVSGFAEELRVALVLAGAYHLVLSDLASEYWTLTATKRQTEANIALAVSPVVFVATVIPWLMSGGGLGGIVTCLIAGSVTSAVVARILRRYRVGVVHLAPGRASFEIARGLIGRQAAPYATFGVAFTLLQADTLIVSIFGGAGMAAEFVLVWKIAEMLVFLIWKIPESLQPYLIEADFAGDRARIGRMYRTMVTYVRLLSLVAGAAYALLGATIVALWVGRDHAPDDTWSFVLAGGAVAWLGSARVPALFAYALKRFGRLNPIILAEVSVKLLLIAALVPSLGHGAPLAAVNLAHVFGVAWAYVWLGRTVAETPACPADLEGRTGAGT